MRLGDIGLDEIWKTATKVSLQRQLQGVFGLWLLFSAVAVFHSVVPPADLPYGVRVVLLAGLFGFMAFQLALLRAVSIACDRWIDL